MKTTPMRVAWTSHEDLQCAILGALGFSTKFICEETGLTPCQISYRLKKGGVKRSDYRNGTSKFAQRVIDRSIPSNKDGIRRILNLNEEKPR